MRIRLYVLLPMAAAMLSACITIQPQGQGPGLMLGTRTLNPDGPTPTPAVAAPVGDTGIHPIGLTPGLDH